MAAPKKLQTCQQCGRSYLPSDRRNRFCSRVCGGAFRRSIPSRSCVRCGAAFRPPFAKSRQRACSRACITPLKPARREAFRCVGCGVAFDVRSGNATNVTLGYVRQFCSRACKYKASRQKWPVERTTKLLYTCQECGKQWHDIPAVRDRKKFCSRACGGLARIRQMATLSPTSIEAEAYLALDALGVRYQTQHAIGRALVDAYLPDSRIVIECQGDFHHCNPALYPDGPQYALQRKTVERDARRRVALAAAGYQLIELWERDIKTRGAQALLKDALRC